MSRRGNGWDNACVESFFGALKRELVSPRHYTTRDEATQDLFEYIEVFYNRVITLPSTITPRPSWRGGRLWRNRGPFPDSMDMILASFFIVS